MRQTYFFSMPRGNQIRDQTSRQRYMNTSPQCCRKRRREDTPEEDLSPGREARFRKLEHDDDAKAENETEDPTYEY